MIRDAAMFSSREPLPLIEAVIGLVGAAGTVSSPR